jgi:hypothetical protein
MVLAMTTPEPYLLLASFLAAAMALLHGLGGERLVVGPLRRRVQPGDEARLALVEGVWHLVTVGLAVVAVGVGVLAFRPQAMGSNWGRAAADGLAVTSLVCATVFVVLTKRRFGAALRLPQWTLFAALGILVAVGAHRPAPPHAIALGAAVLASGVLALLGLLHLYWAAGGKWPGKDAASLARTVVGGGEGLRFPTRTATVLVAIALGASAVLVAVSGGLLPGGALGTLGALGVLGRSTFAFCGWALVAVFLLRGLGGFFEIYLRPSIAGSPYARWNVVLYSPLCLVLAALIALTLSGTSGAPEMAAAVAP